jgi:hypothetical protein
MRKTLFAAAAIWASMSTAALSQTLPLNTGFDHGNLALYAPGAQDQYWIKIASYEPPATGNATIPVAAAWTYGTNSNWQAPISFGTAPVLGSRWIGPHPSPASPGGVSFSNPGYSIYRKCFCMLQGFQNAKIDISIMADDVVHVWLNDVNRTLVAPAGGHFNSGAPLTNTNKNPGIKVGRNCIYVLVEEVNGDTGFDLAGAVSVDSGGMMPLPAAGPDMTFAPCQCLNPSGPSPSAAWDADSAIRAIVAFAEARRTGTPARRAFGGAAPARTGTPTAAE